MSRLWTCGCPIGSCCASTPRRPRKRGRRKSRAVRGRAHERRPCILDERQRGAGLANAAAAARQPGRCPRCRDHQNLLLHRPGRGTAADRRYRPPAGPRYARRRHYRFRRRRALDPQRGARRRGDGRRNHRTGCRQPLRRLRRVADSEDRDRSRSARGRRCRHEPRAGARLRDARRGRPAGDPFDPGRFFDRRQPRHPRPARHGRRTARRQHAYRDRGKSQRPQSRRGDRPLAPRSRGAGREPVCGRPRLSGQ